MIRKKMFRAALYAVAVISILFAVSFSHAGDSTSFDPTGIEVTSEPISGVPIGGVIEWFSPTIPKDFLLCNGQSFSATEYPKLQAALNGATNVPDLRGVVLRGVDNGRGIDPGRTLNSFQAATSGTTLERQTTNAETNRFRTSRASTISSSGGWSSWGVTSGGGSSTEPYFYRGSWQSKSYKGAVRFRLYANGSGGPANVATNYVMKAK